MITLAKLWVQARLKERTTWDGTVLIAGGVAYLVLGPIAEVAAWAAIGYGAWTLWKKEK